MQLRRVREGTQLEEDHMRNRQAIVHWLMANTDAIVGAACATARPITCSRASERSAQGVGGLLAEVQRIKSRGRLRRRRGRCSRPTACTSTPRSATRSWRESTLHLPSYTGFVMPTLTPEHDADGEITDVAISYSCDFAAQMLSYSEERRRSA